MWSQIADCHHSEDSLRGSDGQIHHLRLQDIEDAMVLPHLVETLETDSSSATELGIGQPAGVKMDLSHLLNDL